MVCYFGHVPKSFFAKVFQNEGVVRLGIKKAVAVCIATAL